MTVHLLWTYWMGKEEFQVSLKIADEVMEEMFIWIQGRECLENNVLQIVPFYLWEAMETSEGAEQHMRNGEGAAR